MNDFYLYEHWRPDKNTCFYVGKGRGIRAWAMSKDRNSHHRAIQSKLTAMGLSVDVRVVISNLSSDTAYALERDRIAMYGIENLSNMTHGGMGVPDPTAETRAKMSASSRKRWSDPEFRKIHAEAARIGRIKNNTSEKIAIRRRGTKASLETRAKMSASQKGKKRSEEHCKRVSGSGNPFFGKTHTPETLERVAAKKRGTKLSEETKAKMRESQAARRLREAANKPPKIVLVRERAPFRHSPETIEKMRLAAKIRGVHPATRAAHKLALTGRKRAPFTDDTRAKMRAASVEREAKKKATLLKKKASL